MNVTGMNTINKLLANILCQPPFFGANPLDIWGKLNKLLFLQCSAPGRDTENRFDTAITAGDGTYGAGGCDGGAGSVSHGTIVFGIPYAALAIRETALLPGQILVSLMGMFKKR